MVKFPGKKRYVTLEWPLMHDFWLQNLSDDPYLLAHTGELINQCVHQSMLCGLHTIIDHDLPKWASVKLGDTLGMPIWLETINGI